MRKCYKCNILVTALYEIPDIDANQHIVLCGRCAIKFILTIAEWKDFDIKAELEYWKTGRQSNE